MAKLIGGALAIAAMIGAIGFTIQQARGFATDQYERGQSEMSALVEAATLKAKDAARIASEAREKTEADRRKELERRIVAADAAAAAALAKLKGANADVAKCMALPWPDDVRRHFPVVLRNEMPAAGDDPDRDREAAAGVGA